MRTHHFLEVFDLVNSIVMETGLTKIEFMFTVTQMDLQCFIFGFFDFILTNLTLFDILELLSHVEQPAHYRIRHL